MDKIVILHLPVALLFYGIALFLSIYDLHYKATKGIFTILSSLLVVGTTAYAILMGASLQEGSLVLLAFLLLEMGVKN
jgi:hypothetical protein